MTSSPVMALRHDLQLALIIKAISVVQMATNYVKHQTRAPLSLLQSWTTMLIKPWEKLFVIMLNMVASEWIRSSLPPQKRFWFDVRPVVSQLTNILDPPRSVSKFFLNNFILRWKLWNQKSATCAKKVVWLRNMVALIGTIMQTKQRHLSALVRLKLLMYVRHCVWPIHFVNLSNGLKQFHQWFPSVNFIRNHGIQTIRPAQFLMSLVVESAIGGDTHSSPTKSQSIGSESLEIPDQRTRMWTIILWYVSWTWLYFSRRLYI